MSSQDTNSGCRVCEYPITFNSDLCLDCYRQRDEIDKIRRQKKRDAHFGNIWEEAGVKDV